MPTRPPHYEYVSPEPTAEKRMAHEIFGSYHKLELGMWIVQREVGVPFDFYEISKSFDASSMVESWIRHQMQHFVKASFVERIEPELSTENPNNRVMWSKLDNPWWRVFKAANIAAKEVNQIGK